MNLLEQIKKKKNLAISKNPKGMENGQAVSDTRAARKGRNWGGKRHEGIMMKPHQYAFRILRHLVRSGCEYQMQMDESLGAPRAGTAVAFRMLKKAGFIEVDHVEAGFGKDRVYYKATELGKEEYYKAKAKWEDEVNL